MKFLDFRYCFLLKDLGPKSPSQDKFSKRGPKIFFRKFHEKLFWIRTNTMLNTKHTKYEGLTPPELGERGLQSRGQRNLPEIP